MNASTFWQAAIVGFAFALGCGHAERSKPVRVSDGPEEQLSPDASSAEAIAVFDAAAIAHGEAREFPRARIGRMEYEVEGEFQPGLKGRFVINDVFKLPGRNKRTVIGTLSTGDRFHMVSVRKDDRAWLQFNEAEPGETPIINPDATAFPSANLDMLVNATKPPNALRVRPNERIQGREARCIRVEVEGNWNSDCYIDRESNLVVASKKRLMDITIGRERSVETYYSEFKTIDGLTLPMLVTSHVDGIPFFTMKIRDLTFLKDLDDDEFAKPVARSK